MSALTSKLSFLILLYWTFNVQVSGYYLIGDVPIYRGDIDLDGTLTTVKIDPFKVPGTIRRLIFYARSTSMSLHMWLFRSVPGSADPKRMKPLIRKVVEIGDYSYGINEIILDWPCEAGDRIGFRSGIISGSPGPYDYWTTRVSATVLDQDVTLETKYNGRVLSFLAIYEDALRAWPVFKPGNSTFVLDAADVALQEPFLWSSTNKYNFQKCLLFCNGEGFCTAASWREDGKLCMLTFHPYPVPTVPSNGTNVYKKVV